MNQILKKIKNSKGMTSIEVGISVIILIMVISGFVDLTTILRKQTTLSNASTYVARTVGLQGGVRGTEPEQFEGYSYTNNKELYDNLNTMFKDAGISSNNWTCTINGYKLSSSTNTPLYDFGQDIKINLTIDYDWGLVSNFIPGTLHNHRTSERIITSSYKIRNGGWSSDYK